MSQGAVFLDRDGTLNREQGFVTSVDQLQILPGALDAVRQLAAAGFAPIVVTNQSGIARGLYTERDLTRVHEATHRALDALPLAYLHCPHHPDQSGPYGRTCTCRKPGSGLLHQATELFALDLGTSFCVGDSARDILMARDLPVQTVLVRSGKPWREQLAELERQDVAPDHIADDLAAATAWILAQ